MGDPRRLLERRFAARPAQLKEIRSAIRDVASASGCGTECASDIVMAIDEACQNIIRHAYCGDRDGEIVLAVDREGDRLVFSLRDFAPPVDPECVKPRDLADIRPGGLGTHLMREVMDECEFVEPPAGNGNLLRMVKRIA